MAHITGRGEIIVIDDDDDDDVKDSSRALKYNKYPSGDRRKRKARDASPDKVHWTDESDHVPAKPKKRRAKKKSAASIEDLRGHAMNEDEAGAPDDDSALYSIPDYLQHRRQQFDADRKAHHDGALLIPPDYYDIDLDDSRGPEELTKRPEFDALSGVKPSRPCRDIELRQSAGIIPACIAQYLRDYQVDGVKFLHRKFVYQEGCILGDDMGLGKTVQVAAFLTVAFGKTGDERDAKRLRQMRFYSDRWYPKILIICPGSLIMNWRNELSRWGWWHVDTYHGTNKDDVLGTARAGMLEIMITTYDTYKNARSSINMVKWDAVIADECHRLKDRKSETTKAMSEVNALCRIGLTGTAIQNKYEELWTLLDWTNPGHFGTKSEWTATISKPLAVGQSHEATNAQLSLARQTAKKLVQNLLPRYFLRRMKSLIAHQLPKKTDRVVFCPLTDFQREAYENFVESRDIQIIKSISDICKHGNKKGWCCGKFLPSGRTWQSIIFPSMMTLQKLSNHVTLLVPRTTDLEGRHDSELNTLRTCFPDTWRLLYDKRDQITSKVNPEYCGKWKILKKLLKFWHTNGDKVLVFSHSVRLLKILHHLFTNTSYSVSYLDGSLKYEERQDIVDTFNSDPTQFVFLISTKAGGVGLNITSANKVVIIDPHWNPSYDLQAQDRAYRIGQTRDVEVFRLISLGTVEEVVYARQIYKQQQANIGYTASSERRYFKGVQQDSDRKGEIFGLNNIFTYHTDSGLLQDIVNKTNIAEARAGVNLLDVDMEQAANDDENLGALKKEEADNDDGGIGQLAALLTADDQHKVIENRKAAVPKSDAIQAILTSAGVEYTHDNAEVIGSSKVEEELSKRAQIIADTGGTIGAQSSLFKSPNSTRRNEALHQVYNPPEDVCLRQFCEMAHELDFVSAKEFALIVESWSQEARTNCLDIFYKKREAKLKRENGTASERNSTPIRTKNEETEMELKPDVKSDGKSEAKFDIKNEIEAEHMYIAESTKPEDVKSKLEDVMDQPLAKLEMENDPEIKPEDNELKRSKVQGRPKRASIFLVDNDDDDNDEL